MGAVVITANGSSLSLSCAAEAFVLALVLVLVFLIRHKLFVRGPHTIVRQSRQGDQIGRRTGSRPDAYATDYLDNWSNPSKIVPFIHALKASIAIAGVTITRNLARRLRQTASSPKLQEHIMAKNGWNDWIFQSIDWDAQAKALSTNTTRNSSSPNGPTTFYRPAAI